MRRAELYYVVSSPFYNERTICLVKCYGEYGALVGCHILYVPGYVDVPSGEYIKKKFEEKIKLPVTVTYSF